MFNTKDEKCKSHPCRQAELRERKSREEKGGREGWMQGGRETERERERVLCFSEFSYSCYKNLEVSHILPCKASMRLGENICNI